MFTLTRALTYAALFIAFVFVFVPANLLQWNGFLQPVAIGAPQIAGAALVLLGGAIALWCVVTLAVVGRGTPAPFDPPRRLVVRGPYRFVRNPMYLGAGLALAGAALFYCSVALAAYTLLYLALLHALVRVHEEPSLRRTFGAEYVAYCSRVRRWWPVPRALAEPGAPPRA